MQPPRAVAWGEHGHQISGRSAVRKLPKEMPRFFREAADQLVYLNPEPDRWRDQVEAKIDPAMNAAYAPDHYINFERITDVALAAPNRYLYIAEIQRAAGTDQPLPGFLPFHILELTQRLRAEWRLWRTAPDKQRRWIERRIVNDAGLLGHYVTDGANPHHTTIHHNGWIGDNPNAYATDKEFHGRFESTYVQTHITIADLLPNVKDEPRVIGNLRAGIINHLRTSHREVERLYQIDKRARFGEETTAAENKKFAVERLAAGAEMLRDLWWTAWATSAVPASVETTKK